jgi:hypothetical protein
MRNAISILLLLVLFILTPVLFVVTSARLNVLTSEFVKQELVKLDIYGLATSRIDTEIQRIVIDPKYPITHAELAELAHSVLSEEWLQSTVEGTLDRVDDWLNSKPGTVLSIPIDLREPKQQLTAGIDTLLTTKLPQIEPCPNKRIPKQEQGICQFAGMTLPQLKEELGHQGLNPDLINELLPDTLDLLNPDLSKIVGPNDASDPNSAAVKSQEIIERLDQAKARYQRVVFLLNLALVIYALLVLLFVALHANRGWHHFTRWSGVLFLTIGVLPLALAVASGPVIERQVLPKLHFDAKTPVELTRAAPQLIRDTRSALLTPLLIVGGSLVVLGLTGIVGAHWVTKPNRVGRRSP